MRLDQTNLSIIRQLRDGRKSFKVIADKLNLSENTVRSRVQRMTQEGLLEISGLVKELGATGAFHSMKNLSAAFSAFAQLAPIVLQPLLFSAIPIGLFLISLAILAAGKARATFFRDPPKSV